MELRYDGVSVTFCSVEQMLKQLLILSCLLFIQYTSAAMSFKVFLREGIVGGFAGPTIKYV
jgi:hypothetical protein